MSSLGGVKGSCNTNASLLVINVNLVNKKIRSFFFVWPSSLSNPSQANYCMCMRASPHYSPPCRSGAPVIQSSSHPVIHHSSLLSPRSSSLLTPRSSSTASAHLATPSSFSTTTTCDVPHRGAPTDVVLVVVHHHPGHLDVSQCLGRLVESFGIILHGNRCQPVQLRHTTHL